MRHAACERSDDQEKLNSGSAVETTAPSTGSYRICGSRRRAPILHVPNKPSPSLLAALNRVDRLLFSSESFATWVPPTLQMAFQARPDRTIDVEREVVPLPDGGQAALDWIGRPSASPEPTMIIFCMPGIGASSSQGFMSARAHYFAEAIPGARVAVMVAQGLDGLPLSSRCVMSTAYLSTDDPGHLISHIAEKHRGVPIVVYGNSVGSGHFVRWAGANPEWLARCNVVGAVLLCFGYSVELTSAAGDTALGVSSFVLNEWKASFDANASHIRRLEEEVPDFSIQRLLESKTICEWETATCPLYKFVDRQEMLACVETGDYSHKLAVPVVYIGSDDDPLTPATRLLDNYLGECGNAAILRSHGGGHMGWWSGRPWALRQDWISQVSSALLGALAHTAA